MDSKHEDMIISTATNVEWLVEDRKENIKKLEIQDQRIGSLEKSRARAKGATWFAGVVAGLSSILYKVIGG